jgi:MFS family permease
LENNEIIEKYVSLFFIVFAATMISIRPFTRRLYDRKGPNAVIYPSLIFFALGLFLLSTMSSVITLLIAGGLIGIGYGSLFPCFQALAIQSAPKHRNGHVTSAFLILFDSGMAIGAFELGIVSAQWGLSTLYLLCGVVTILTIIVYWRIVGGNKESKEVIYSKSVSSQRP